MVKINKQALSDGSSVFNVSWYVDTHCVDFAATDEIAALKIKDFLEDLYMFSVSETVECL